MSKKNHHRLTQRQMASNDDNKKTDCMVGFFIVLKSQSQKIHHKFIVGFDK